MSTEHGTFEMVQFYLGWWFGHHIRNVVPGWYVVDFDETFGELLTDEVEFNVDMFEFLVCHRVLYEGYCTLVVPVELDWFGARQSEVFDEGLEEEGFLSRCH